MRAAASPDFLARAGRHFGQSIPPGYCQPKEEC
jgi:hypothetical protein